MGRLDHLVEAVYERFKDRYFKGESTCCVSMALSRILTFFQGVLVDLTGIK